MFVPALTCTTTELLTYSIRCCQGKTNELSLKASLFKIIKHIPHVQTFVHFTTFLKLKRARDETAKAIKFYKSFNPDKINDSNRQSCKEQIEKAAEKYKEAKENYMRGMTDFQELKLYEAFGEAAPQVEFVKK